jgi:hypothetical protein
MGREARMIVRACVAAFAAVVATITALLFEVG